jgi:hypothetical protein
MSRGGGGRGGGPPPLSDTCQLRLPICLNCTARREEAKAIVEDLGAQAKQLKKEAADTPESKLLGTKPKRWVKILQLLVQES